jgi:hypothetical protein
MTEDRGKPNDWAAKQAAIDAAAKAIIDQEINERDAKTARLKAMREERVAAEPAEAPTPRRAAAKSKTRRVRARG